MSTDRQMDSSIPPITLLWGYNKRFTITSLSKGNNSMLSTSDKTDSQQVTSQIMHLTKLTLKNINANTWKIYFCHQPWSYMTNTWKKILPPFLAPHDKQMEDMILPQPPSDGPQTTKITFFRIRFNTICRQCSFISDCTL